MTNHTEICRLQASITDLVTCGTLEKGLFMERSITRSRKLWSDIERDGVGGVSMFTLWTQH